MAQPAESETAFKIENRALNKISGRWSQIQLKVNSKSGGNHESTEQDQTSRENQN